jgi:hypothetical protein
MYVFREFASVIEKPDDQLDLTLLQVETVRWSSRSEDDHLAIERNVSTFDPDVLVQDYRLAY